MLTYFDKRMTLLEYTVLLDNFSSSLFFKENIKNSIFLRLACFINIQKKFDNWTLVKFLKFTISSISINYCIKFICCFYYKHVKTFNKKSELLLPVMVRRVDAISLYPIFFHKAEIAQLIKHSFVNFFQNS